MKIVICTFILILCQVVIMILARSGPFKASLTRVGPCVNPTQPVDSEPASYFFAELYNTTTHFNLMRGNHTVKKDLKIQKVKGKSYVWDNGKWKLSFQINNMGCNRIYFPVLSSATGLNYDTVKTCTLFKGIYPYEGFDVNKIEHMWMSSQEYGKVLWRIEAFSQTGTVWCYDFETFVEQVK